MLGLNITLPGMGSDMLVSTSHTLVPIPNAAATGLTNGWCCSELLTSLQHGGAGEGVRWFFLFLVLFICLVIVFYHVAFDT